MWARIGDSAQRKAIPLERFDGIRAIQAHLNQRSQVEAFVYGYSATKPDVEAECGAECAVGKWLHSAGGAHCTDIKLLDTLRASCREFREVAAQAVLLAEIGKSDAAVSIIKSERYFGDASERYQSCLAKLHLACELV